tara:strand:- start:269 stop:571 length:303 start_codon:yes stop_codon:yes gene_type:complete
MRRFPDVIVLKEEEEEEEEEEEGCGDAANAPGRPSTMGSLPTTQRMRTLDAPHGSTRMVERACARRTCRSRRVAIADSTSRSTRRRAPPTRVVPYRASSR